MLIFNLKKEWFNKIKSGEKTHEYREVKDYWTNRIMKSLYHEYLTNEAYFVSMCRFGGQKWIKPIFPEIIFRNGYPRSGQKDRELKAIVKKITIKHGAVTDLKFNGAVYDIEFELIKGNK